MRKLRGVAGVGLAGLLWYPATFAGLAVADAWRGERLVLYQLRHERRFLWDTFWADYAAALPSAFLGVLVVVGAYSVLWRLGGGRPGPVALVPMTAVATWSAATYLSGSWMGVGQLAVMAGGAVAALPLWWGVRGLVSVPSAREGP